MEKRRKEVLENKLATLKKKYQNLEVRFKKKENLTSSVKQDLNPA